MSVIRAFIAIDLPSDIQEGLAKLSAQLKDEIGGKSVRWIPIPNIHLTIKFLGDVSENNLDVLKEIICAEVRLQKPMEISVGRLGAFPKERHPRVIWVGVEAPDELISLQRGIETCTTKIGYPEDKRPFFPHLTIGRVSRNAPSADVRKIGNIISSNKVGFLGAASLQEIHFYKSELLPGGAEYTKLFTAPFGEASN
jgi:2'-5' RNA ligase